jgi:hypothetical protein
MMSWSKRTSEDIDDANERRCVPLDSDSAIDFIIPEAGAGDVESAVCLLHDDAIGDELEVPIDCCDILENLDMLESTSSQIWLVQICASLTL